jgi:hypothetical protein
MGEIVARICGFVKCSPMVVVRDDFTFDYDYDDEYDEYE